jgi:drug/metabolite transporter (DMT)-like permease
MVCPGQSCGPRRWPPLFEHLAPGTKGTIFGLAAVLAWAAYNIGVAAGRADGFSVADLTLLRYLGATLALTPWVLLQGAPRGTRVGWKGLLLLLALAGPHFGVIYNIGMPLTRLSHAVVISPGFSMLVAFVLTALSLKTWPSSRSVVGLAVLIVALVCVAADRQGTGAGSASTLHGDLIFVLTGTLYGTFAFLLGRWKGDAVQITWIMSLASLVIVGPAYLIFATPTDHTALAWAVQFILQGVLGGGWAIALYALSINHLGSGRAGIFPALVPIATVPLSLPITGLMPSVYELVGIALAACGMMLSLRGQDNRAPNAV